MTSFVPEVRYPFTPEEVVEQHRYTAQRVVRELYAALGVAKRYVRSRLFPEDTVEHPSLHLAFSQERKVVYHRGQEDSLLYLPTAHTDEEIARVQALLRAEEAK